MLYVALDSDGKLVTSLNGHVLSLYCPFCSKAVSLTNFGYSFVHSQSTDCAPCTVEQLTLLIKKNTEAFNLHLPYAEIQTTNSIFESTSTPARTLHLPSKKIVSQPEKIRVYTTDVLSGHPLPIIKTMYKQRTLFLLLTLNPHTNPDLTFASDLEIYTSSILQIHIDQKLIPHDEHYSLQSVIDRMPKSWVRHEPLIIEAQEYYRENSNRLLVAVENEASTISELEALGVISTRKNAPI